jgi:hypothetical protein
MRLSPITVTAYAVCAIALAMVACARTLAQSMPASSAETPDILADYLYGFVPAIMKATRDNETAVPDNRTPGKAPINQFSYRQTLITPQDQPVVRSDVDTLYASAWLDLLREPVVLHVPDAKGRYYLVPMLDAYSNEFYSVGSRTTGDAAGNYAIIGPDSKGSIPEDISSVITAPTNTVWILSRILVEGPEDLQAAGAVNRQFLLIPLSEYPEYLRTRSYTPPTGVPVKAPNPHFVGKPLPSSPGFSSPEFFDFLLPYALLNPVPADQRSAAATYVWSGFFNQEQMTPAIRSEALKAIAAEEIENAGNKENGWSLDLNIGRYDSNYLLRDAVAVSGLGANIPADAVYLNAHEDISGKDLSGENSYAIHFPPGQLPPERGFWSITVYDQSGFLVPNTIDRYDVGSESGLIPNQDGSVDILLQSAAPTTRQTNWLPIPSGVFNLTLRVYWPSETVLNGVWLPPPVMTNSPPTTAARCTTRAYAAARC